MQRFVENTSIDARLIKRVELNNRLKEKLAFALKERKLTETVGSEPTAWEVPISRYDEVNANGRIYPRALWERVINQQRHIWEGAPMLADHPANDSDGDPSRICGIWLDARIGDDGYVYGTFVPSGSLGRDMQEHLRNGLRAGTSSSGFGELLPDGKTVDPDTYMIERLSDWVLTPSQGTYFKYEAATQETKNASTTSGLQESTNIVKGNISMKITKLEEKKFRKDMEAFLEDAQKITDPQERLREFEEILSYFEEGVAGDLKERVLAKIEEEKLKIRKKLEEASKLETELGVNSTEELKEKLVTIAEDAKVLQSEITDWKAIATTLQKKLDKAREDLQQRPTNAYVEHLRNKIKKLYAEKKKADADKIALQARIEKASKKKEGLLEAIDAEIQEYKNQVAEQIKIHANLRAQIERLQARNASLEKNLQETKAAFEQYKERVEAEPKLQESPGIAVARHVNFREADEVDRYWADLVLRHGEDIKMYERRIRSAKTVREAMNIYMKILPTLNEGAEYEKARIPESVGISLAERGVLLEKAGAKLTVTDINDRLPPGWV